MGGPIAFAFVITCGLMVYFLPTICGWGKRNRAAIFLLNLLLGWTLIGWVVALVWAFTVDPQQQVHVTQIETSGVFCSTCGRRASAGENFCGQCGALVADLPVPSKSPSHAQPRILLGICVAVALLVGIVLYNEWSKPESSSRSPSAAGVTLPVPLVIASPVEPQAQNETTPPTISHEQKLIDLRKRREVVATEAAIAGEFGRKMARDYYSLNAKPFPDPNELKDLMDRIDKEAQRIQQLTEELKAIDAEISDEEKLNKTPSLQSALDIPDPPPTPLNDEKIKQLTKERRYLTGLIAAADGILSTGAVQEKAAIYCRFTYDKAYELAGDQGNKEVRDYARQGNIQSCIARILAGYQTMLSDEQLKEKAADARKRIAEIDEELAQRK